MQVLSDFLPSFSRMVGSFFCTVGTLQAASSNGSLQGLATIVVAQALCLSIFNLSPTQKTCLFTDGNKANVCAGPSRL